MSYCEVVPTRTLFGVSISSAVTQQEVFTNEITTLPDVTSTFTITSQTCTPSGPLASLIAPCDPFTYLSTTVIQGSTITKVESSASDSTAYYTFTVPTKTEFSTSCITQSTTTTTTTTSSPKSPTFPTSSTSSTFSTTSSGLLPDVSPTFSLSTPDAVTFNSSTSITTGGSVIFSNVAMTSQPPAATIFSDPNNRPNRKSDATGPVIGGVIGGVVGFCFFLGAILCFWRKKRRKERKARIEYENDVTGVFGRRLELDTEDDDGHYSSAASPGEKYYDTTPRSERPPSSPLVSEMAPMLTSPTSSPRLSRRPFSDSVISGTQNERRRSTISTVPSDPSLHSQQILIHGLLPATPSAPTSPRESHRQSVGSATSLPYAASGTSLSKRPSPASRYTYDFFSGSHPLHEADEHGRLQPPAMTNDSSYSSSHTKSHSTGSLSAFNGKGTSGDHTMVHTRNTSVNSIQPIQMLKITNRTRLDGASDDEDSGDELANGLGLKTS